MGGPRSSTGELDNLAVDEHTLPPAIYHPARDEPSEPTGIAVTVALVAVDQRQTAAAIAARCRRALSGSTS